MREVSLKDIRPQAKQSEDKAKLEAMQKISEGLEVLSRLKFDTSDLVKAIQDKPGIDLAPLVEAIKSLDLKPEPAAYKFEFKRNSANYIISAEAKPL